MTDVIEKLDCPSKEAFEKSSHGRARPVVIKNAMTEWKALTLWTLAAFRIRFEDTLVPVTRSTDGIFRGDPEVGFTKSFEHMRVGHFFDLLEGTIPSQYKFYLAQLPVAGPFLPLMAEIAIPNYIDSKLLTATNLWVGPSGVVSPLHFDSKNNFLCQVFGSKRLVFFPPEESRYLYPFARTSKIPHMSRVDIDKPDLNRFPQFKHARPLTIELASGDMIYIPHSWWHQVYSLSDSMSVNFWY